jgi:hypothetical protein
MLINAEIGSDGKMFTNTRHVPSVEEAKSTKKRKIPSVAIEVTERMDGRMMVRKDMIKTTSLFSSFVLLKLLKLSPKYLFLIITYV